MQVYQSEGGLLSAVVVVSAADQPCDGAALLSPWEAGSGRMSRFG